MKRGQYYCELFNVAEGSPSTTARRSKRVSHLKVAASKP